MADRLPKIGGRWRGSVDMVVVVQVWSVVDSVELLSCQTGDPAMMCRGGELMGCRVVVLMGCRARLLLDY